MQYVYFSGLCGYQFASTFQSFALPVEKNSTTQIQKYNYIKYDEQIPWYGIYNMRQSDSVVAEMGCNNELFI